MAGMSEAQARRVLDDPNSTPEQRRQAEIVLGMPPASTRESQQAGVPPGPGAGPPGPGGPRTGPPGPPGPGAGPPGPPPESAEMTPSERVEAETQAQRQKHLTEKERLAALEAMDLSKYEK